MPILRPEERLGSVLSERYRLDRILGKGGMGVVFAGTHTWTGRPIAVKSLLPQYTENPTLLKRFFQEARAAAALEHPNVIDVLDMGEDDEGEPYIVLEYLAGEPFSALLKRSKTLDLETVLPILLPVMDALCEAHAQGIVHRDLKPDNIFVAEGVRGRSVPKLLDFGISKLLESQTVGTATGGVIGTPHYMSPEQAAGKKNVDGRSDVFSMGVVLYRALTGEFHFAAETPTMMLVKIMTQPAPPIRDAAPDLHPSVAKVIDHALEADLDERIQTMSEFVTALVHAAGDAGIELDSQLLDYRSDSKARPKKKAPAKRKAPAKKPSDSPLPAAAKDEGSASPKVDAEGATRAGPKSKVKSAPKEDALMATAPARKKKNAPDAKPEELAAAYEPTQPLPAEEEVEEEEEVAEAPGGPVVGNTKPIGAAEPTSIPLREPPRAAGLNPGFVAAGVAALVMLGGLSWWQLGESGEPEPAGTVAEPPDPTPPEPEPEDVTPVPAEPPPVVVAAPEMRERLVLSDPLGASVMIDSEVVGQTPLTLEVPADGSLEVTVSRDGYVDQTVSVSGHVTGPQTVALTREGPRSSRGDLAPQ